MKKGSSLREWTGGSRSNPTLGICKDYVLVDYEGICLGPQLDNGDIPLVLVRNGGLVFKYTLDLKIFTVDFKINSYSGLGVNRLTGFERVVASDEVVDTFENPTIPWVTLDSPTDLTSAFTDEWRCVNYALPSPLQVQHETVTNITIDAHGVIYLNRAGYDNRRYATYGYGLDYEIDGNCVVVAPYWSDLEIADIIGPSSIRVGTAHVGTNDCFVVEYANMYYDTYWGDETNAVSFQVAIPLGRADHISVKFANLVGERMDGRNAGIGFQSFGFRDYSEYSKYSWILLLYVH